MTFFAALIRRLGLTQPEAAHYLGVSLGSVDAWCRGRRNVPPDIYATLHGLAIQQLKASKAIAATMRKTKSDEIVVSIRPGEWPSDGAGAIPFVDAWIDAGDGRRVTVATLGT
jgi:transcriptional regulator with XRE-family HTH domain